MRPLSCFLFIWDSGLLTLRGMLTLGALPLQCHVARQQQQHQIHLTRSYWLLVVPVYTGRCIRNNAWPQSDTPILQWNSFVWFSRLLLAIDRSSQPRNGSPLCSHYSK